MISSCLQGSDQSTVFFQILRKTPVVAEPGHFILSAEFANGFHIINKSVFFDGMNLQGLQNISGNEIIIINIFFRRLLSTFLANACISAGRCSNSTNHS